jgi:hypothetical protein
MHEQYVKVKMKLINLFLLQQKMNLVLQRLIENELEQFWWRPPQTFLSGSATDSHHRDESENLAYPSQYFNSLSLFFNSSFNFAYYLFVLLLHSVFVFKFLCIYSFFVSIFFMNWVFAEHGNFVFLDLGFSFWDICWSSSVTEYVIFFISN